MTLPSDDSSADLSVFFPKSDTRCTKTYSSFLTEYHSHVSFFFFVTQTVGWVDASRRTAAEALLGTTDDKAEKKRYQDTIDSPNTALKQLQKHAKVVSQNLTNGIVSSFQRYFSGIIQSVAIKKPVVLSSSQTIKIEDVLKFARHKDVISYIVDRKINDLSYGGLSDMEKYFDERLGIKMFNNDIEKGLLKFFVEARNINLHNGAVVNDLFASRVGKVEGFPYQVGQGLRMDLDDLAILSGNAMTVASTIDHHVAAKFKLRRRAHSEWKDS